MGGESSKWSTSGRPRPTTAADVTNTMDCTEIAMAGTTASHHCRVRHHSTAMATTHAAMMKKVAPMLDHAEVSALSADVRPDWSRSLTTISPGKEFRGPTMSRPMPTTTAQSATAGARVRRARSAMARRNVGADVSSR